MPLAAATRLGPYEILAPLGAGGMGEVYRARDTRLGREVAIKVLPSHLQEQPEARARFEREARMVSALNHPHVCVLHDVCREGTLDYLVLELVAGESLADRLRRGPLPIADVQRIGSEIAEGLAAAHRIGVVHRDLKPANVMLSPSGAKLMDFGLALMPGRERFPAGPPLSESPTVSLSLTAADTIPGTLEYLSPEQIEGHEATERSDLWSLGCVLYEMATGRRPFAGPSHAAVMTEILKSEPPAVRDLQPLAPVSLDQLVRACLAKDPARRWQSASDLALALRWPADSGRAETRSSAVIDRQYTLTAADVRRLAERDPRLVGHPIHYFDNQIDSDVLVVLLHGVGGDGRRFERTLSSSTHRTVAPTLIGFAPREEFRPALSFDDHSRIVRVALRHLVLECRPKRTVLVGFSAGSDQFLRMLLDEEGLGTSVDGLVALAPNVSLETCIGSRYFAKIAARDSNTLDLLRQVGGSLDSLQSWLTLQHYMSQTFIKLGANLEPLRRYSADLVAPFEQPGEPLAMWYRRAVERVPSVRLVFSFEETGPARALLARHLEHDVLGKHFTEDSFAFESVHHVDLPDPDIIARHVDSVLSAPRSGR